MVANQETVYDSFAKSAFSSGTGILILLSAVFVWFQLCDNLSGIPRKSNLSQTVMAEDFLKRDIPVIVTDAMDDWPARELFTVDFIHQVCIPVI